MSTNLQRLRPRLLLPQCLQNLNLLRLSLIKLNSKNFIGLLPLSRNSWMMWDFISGTLRCQLWGKISSQNQQIYPSQILLIIDRDTSISSPQHDTSSSPFPSSSPSSKWCKQSLTARSAVLNDVLLDETLRDRADPSSSQTSAQVQHEKHPKHKCIDIWQKEFGFEIHREYLDFRIHLHHWHADS